MSLTEEVGAILLAERAFEDRPLTEQALADQFGTSRTPIREALLELENQEVVVRRQRKGVYLRVPAVSEIDELYEVRASLEGLAARRVARSARPVDIDHLYRLSRQYEEETRRGQWPRADELDGQLHGFIVKVSGNGLLIRTLSGFAMMKRAFFLNHQPYSVGVPGDNAVSHEQIIQSIADGDAEGAELLMRRHILDAGGRIINAVAEAADG